MDSHIADDDSDDDTGSDIPDFMRPDHETDSNEPDFRATVLRGGIIRLVNWAPWLATWGPFHTLLDARGRAGVGIVDLTVVRNENDVAVELIAEFRSGDTPAHRESLCAWAARVGYTRVWFTGEVAELDPVPGGRVHTRCSGCRMRHMESDPSFWEGIRQYGAFPTVCFLCGSDLPQWTFPRKTAAPPGDASKAMSASSHPRRS